jgi:chitinase
LRRIPFAIVASLAFVALLPAIALARPHHPVAPTLSLSASPASVTAGQTSSLSWSSSNSTSCSASWTASTATSGSQSVSPASTTTYSMSCTGGGGSATATATVTVSSTTNQLSPLAPKVAGIYWPNWGGTPALRDIPTEYNLIYAAFAYGDGSQSGTVVWVPDDGSGESATAFKADVQTAHSKGQKVILSVGGQNDLGIHLTNSTQVGQMVNSLNQIVTDYGFDGVDWDLENLSNVNVASLVSASNQLKQRWGQNFVIAAAPAPSATLYKQFAQQLGANLDFFSMQFYGYAATDSQRISGIESRIQEMVNTYGVPASKLGIGCSNYDSDPSLVSSPAVYQQAYDQLDATYPSLRGAFVWDAILESQHGYPFGNTVAKDILGLS